MMKRLSASVMLLLCVTLVTTAVAQVKCPGTNHYVQNERMCEEQRNPALPSTEQPSTIDRLHEAEKRAAIAEKEATIAEKRAEAMGIDVKGKKKEVQQGPAKDRTREDWERMRGRVEPGSGEAGSDLQRQQERNQPQQRN